MPLPTKLRLGFGVLITLVFAGAGWQAWGFAPLARYMPLFIAGMGVLMGIITIVTDLLNYRRFGSAVGKDASETAALGAVERQVVTGGEGAASTEAAEVTQAPQQEQAPAEASRPAAEDDAATAEPDGPEEEAPEQARLDAKQRRKIEMAALRRALGYYGVIIAYVVAIWVFGIFIASAVFLVFFLRVLGKTSWRVPVIGVIVVLGGMLILENLVTVLWPSYLLEDVIGGFMPG